MAVWLAIVLLVVYLVFIGGRFPGAYLVQPQPLNLILIAAFLATWLVWTSRQPHRQPRTAMWQAGREVRVVPESVMEHR